MSGQRSVFFNLAHLARKKMTARQVRWIVGRPLFCAAPALRRRYSVATSYIDIRRVADLVRTDHTERRVELSSALIGYFNRFEAQTRLKVDGTALILPHRFLVFRLRRTAQVTHTGILIDQETGKAIDRSTVELSDNAQSLLRNKFYPCHFRKILEISGPALSLLAQNHFAHFILEDFRKIVAALETVPALQSGSLVVPVKMPAYQRVAFDALARRFPALKIVEVGSDVRVEFDALHVPIEPHDHSLSWFVRVDFLKNVRDIYLDAYGLSESGARTPPFRDLYLSRNRQKLRRVLNEEGIRSRLVACGVEFVQPELLPHRDQVLLLRSARDVIAPTGSSITNILFCQPGARLIETGPVGVYETPFWVGLALAMGMDFLYVPGSPAGWLDHFRVEALHLERVLRKELMAA